ncbi:extracellular sulfatase Sulf-1-like [Oculina patagonica]
MAKIYVVFVVLLLCDFTSAARKPKNNFRSGTRSTGRPNIVFILADDLDSELGSPKVMTKMLKILQREGADFVNAFVTTPMCCPSRASILTGSYAHNHHTFTNNLNCSSQAWRKGPERKSYARYLESSGYVTGYFGKYLNEYDGSWVPVGWNRWEGLLHNSKFYNYTLRHKTYKERHKMSYEHDYFTDLITNRSISFIRRTKAAKPDSPFLAVVSHSAPHGPETAAPQYSNAFPNAHAPRYDNWNFISMDKQWILRETPPMDAQKIAFVDLLHRRRLQTLLSVDDSIERIFHTLQALGIENETYIFFTSDHGYHLGQFGLVKGKSMPFESDIRVPFYVRGPIIPKNIRMKDMVLNIDLAPTFLDIAGVKIPKDMDGVSIMKLFRKTRFGRRAKRRTHVVWRDTFLIERSRGWRRTKSMLEGRSRNKTITAKENKMTLLERICTRPKYQSPCQPNQLWECVTVDRRPRLRKCRRDTMVTIRTTPTTRPIPSTPPTTPVKMCVCMKPRPGTETSENQGDMLPYDDELIVSGLDSLTRELRRSKRSRYSTYSARKKRNEFNAKRYQKELARAMRLQNRRAKSKAFIRTPDTNTKPESNTSGIAVGLYESSEVQQAVEEKLGKLKEKIQGIRMRLGALRDRRKKLLQISARDRLIEYPCPCNHGNATMPEEATTENIENGAHDQDDEQGDDSELQTSPLRRRNKQLKATSRKSETKKKKVKPRRSKCASPGMNCFYQTNYHWKLPPLWTGGEFCFCPNAANNSYWCLRTINSTHNFLYCEFITHFYEYFDLNKDPYQLYNIIDEVSPAVLLELHQQLTKMRDCKGEHCTHYHGKKYPQLKTLPTVSTAPVSHTPESFGKSNERHLPTLPSESSANPLTSEKSSEVLGNRSEVVGNTPESSEDLPFTTHVPTEAIVSHSTERIASKWLKVQTSENREREEEETFVEKQTQQFSITNSSPLPTENTMSTTVSDKILESQRNFSNHFIENERLDKEQINVEKPPQVTVAPVAGSGDMPMTVLVRSSEPDMSSSKTNISSIPPTSASTTLTTEGNTSEMNLKEHFIVKPTRGKSSKRRKNGHREDRNREKDTHGDKQKQKTLKSRKSKKKSSAREQSPVPTENIKEFSVSENQTTSKSWQNVSNHFNEKPDKVEKSSHDTVTPVAGSGAVPTTIVLVRSSEPDTSSSETSISSILPTSASTTLTNEENTSEMNLKEHLTVKPTRGKSSKRRKNGEREDNFSRKGTPKTSKKLRKAKKKLSEKQNSLTTLNSGSSDENKQGIRTAENQTQIEPKSEGESGAELENKGNENGNEPLPDIPRKRNKKPTSKRSSNRNSKGRSKQRPPKRQRPTQISEGGVAEGEVEPSVENGAELPFEPTTPPPEP